MPGPTRWTASEWDEANARLWIRSGGKCECDCRQPLNNSAERHHRKRKREGGDSFANLLLLLPDHHTRVHAEPERSRDNGWIVSAFEDDPAKVKVLIGTRWWRLDNTGGKHPA